MSMSMSMLADPDSESQRSQQEELFAQHLDIDMLISYIDIVGAMPVLESLEMFEKLMPEYITILDSNMIAKDQDGIVSEAHKIKGAAGSIGLARIQRIAQKAQSPDEPAWWENIVDWVEEIKQGYGLDIELLREWIKQHKQ
jgi:two-component system aerobic respiration control sensor histidine kinase ArcB